jgi:hypothetical protein
VIRSSPAQNALQLTNLPTWLWINPAEWVPESKTATVPGESVTATATPGLGHLAPRRRLDGDLPGGGYPVHERG